MEEVCPSRKSHPFWKSTVGSRLTLEMIVPPESQLKCLHVLVYAMASPKTVYKLTTVYFSGEQTDVFRGKSEAYDIVRNEWIQHYRERTKVTFVEHKEVDMSALLKMRPVSPAPSSSDSETPRDTPSPRSPLSLSGSGGWLKCRLSLPLRRSPSSPPESPGASPPSSPTSSSTLSLVPSSPKKTESPRSGQSSPKSGSSSPKSVAVRKSGIFIRTPSDDSVSNDPPKSPKGTIGVNSPRLHRSSNNLFSELIEKTREKYSLETRP